MQDVVQQGPLPLVQGGAVCKVVVAVEVLLRNREFGLMFFLFGQLSVELFLQNDASF